MVSRVLVHAYRVSSNEVSLDVPIRDLGLKSIDVLAIPGDLGDRFGFCIPDLAVWDNPSANDLIDSLLNQRSADSLRESHGHADRNTQGRGSINEPVAVIGVGCRFPGDIDGPERLWDFLTEKKCAITAYPDRGFTNAGTFAESGGFLKDVAGFDNRFFDIPPDEALRMDPQQRLLLEVSWEALEHAGIIPESLRLSRTGVFVGVSSTDYVRLVSASAQQKSTIWDNTGGSSSIIANRISYFLDIQGPSIVIDTACSSSLVAVHLACRSLSTWDCDIALVGGTNVLISPEPWGGFREAGILSQTGCCHAFDKSADGMVRGEGCGVIVLQRLSDARLEGRRILAILTGSAVNQDGKSNGIMAPNPSAQIGVLENACKSARVDPLEIGYVEAHGTGTSLGDRIEAHALGMVFGRKRPGSGPLMIGSIKPNIGHLEGAAGIAGLIKAVLMVERGSLLPSGGFTEPNPAIPFTELGLRVVDELQEWPVVAGRPRRAGVSSFGFGGTNAHVIVEEAGSVGADTVSGRADVGGSGGGVVAWVISGKTASALAAQAGRLGRYVRARPALDVVDVGYSLVSTRSVFDHRAVVVGQTRDELLAGLAGVVAGRPEAGVVCGVGKPAGKTAFVFAGQGSQWLGMGSELYALSVPTLRKDRPEPVSVMTAAAQGFVSGMGLDWASVFSGYRPKRVELPTYAFQHQKFWLAPAPSVSDPTAAGQIGASDGGAELLASSGFAARLAGRSADEQLAAAIEVVCEHAAAVLGRDGAAGLDAGQAFADSGFNSLSAVELRNRLTAVTAVTLPATAIFDHPTPTELAQYLITQIDGHGSSAAAAANPAERIDALTDLFLQACDAGRDADGWKMVALASNTRERMSSPVRNNVSKNVALLADGISDVVVICIPTLTVLSDQREYRDIANAMTGRHSVYSLTLPGFDSSDALPQNADMIVETVSNAIIDVVGGSCRFVLSGYSSGGVLAYALCSHLSVKHQRNPLGVALIDTYLPSQIANPSMNEGFSPNDTGKGLSREVIRVARMLNRLTATRLTAAATYAAIFQAWEPGRSMAPVLNIVAKDRIATVENLREERINRWRTAAAEAAYSVAEVPGDHFGMMSTSSEAIATEIHDWISGLVRGPHP